MKLKSGCHLAYCTNIHRGETWEETFEALKRYTLAVRDRVSPNNPFGIGLRLSAVAAQELAISTNLVSFKKWMEAENTYVFTINGFPYGRFHGTRVKEQVYAPDWTTTKRVSYTKRLFEVLANLLEGTNASTEGSVSTVPCSFKEFGIGTKGEEMVRRNLIECAWYLEELSRQRGLDLHLGLEPEPLCYIETTDETISFFERLHADPKMRDGQDEMLRRRIGVNYDACHLAVEFEDAKESLTKLTKAGIRISKIHLSNALKAIPTPEVRRALRAFVDPVYFHQVIEKRTNGELRRIKDLDLALAEFDREMTEAAEREAATHEWRIHFHVPLHCEPTALWGTTNDHLIGVLETLEANPNLCKHLEMETYTWEVMPEPMKNREVVDQLVGEYEWSLRELKSRGL